MRHVVLSALPEVPAHGRPLQARARPVQVSGGGGRGGRREQLLIAKQQQFCVLNDDDASPERSSSGVRVSEMVKTAILTG